MDLVQTLSKAVEERNGKVVAVCFALPLGHGHMASQPIPHSVVSESLRELTRLVPPYDSYFRIHLQILGKLLDREVLSRESVAEMFKGYHGFVSLFIKHFSASRDNWEIQLFKTVTWNLYQMARKSGKSSLEHTARILSKGFTLTLTDRSPIETSKKRGVFHVVVLLFRIYFRLGTPRLCGNVLRALEAGELPSMQQFRKAEWISYCFYRSRIYIIGQNFAEARELLEKAFVQCRDNDFHNRRMLAIYLVIVEMIHWKIPKPDFLERYRLKSLFLEFADAVRTGNLAKFREALESNTRILLDRDLYWAVAVRLKWLGLRNLVRRIYLILGKPSQIQVATVHLALGQQCSDTSEARCMLVNLVKIGMVRGHLDRRADQLVLARVDPFPKHVY